MSRISVCMATYNGEKYIQRQLASVLNQLDEYDEVIVSDDRSTDGTLQVIAQFQDKRIKVAVNNGVKGPLANFQKAISRATGDYIFLCDQDDIWLPNKVITLRSLLQENDLVLSDCQVVDENVDILYPSFFERRGSQPGFWHNLYKNSYVGCCMAFRREILDYVLPFPANIHMHDWWIGLLVEAKGRVYFYPKPLIQYVRHGANASPTGETGYALTKRLQNRIFMLWYVIRRLMA